MSVSAELPTRGGVRETSPEYGTLSGPLVYYLFDTHGTLIYVGRTVCDLWTRFKGHDDKPWAAWAARTFETYKEAAAFELAEIARLLPTLNKAGRPQWRKRHAEICAEKAAEREAYEARTAHLWPAWVFEMDEQ